MKLHDDVIESACGIGWLFLDKDRFGGFTA